MLSGGKLRLLFFRKHRYIECKKKFPLAVADRSFVVMLLADCDEILGLLNTTAMVRCLSRNVSSESGSLLRTFRGRVEVSDHEKRR